VTTTREKDLTLAVVDRLAAHTHRGVDVRERYQELVQAADPATRFLIQLLLEDERRHQQLTMALGLAVSGDPDALPDLALMTDPDLRYRAAELHRAEEMDREALRELREVLELAPEGALWRLVVDLLKADADRRIRILEFIEENASP
jgi:hypothetical protein